MRESLEQKVTILRARVESDLSPLFCYIFFLDVLMPLRTSARAKSTFIALLPCHHPLFCSQSINSLRSVPTLVPRNNNLIPLSFWCPLWTRLSWLLFYQ